MSRSLRLVLSVATVLAGGPSAALAKDSTVTVPGGANLWLAGGNPAPGDGPGSAPPSIKVPDGATAFTVVSVKGLVSCCNDEPGIPPDGGGVPTTITPVDGQIGPYSGPSNLPLLGLFVRKDKPPPDAKPPDDNEADDTGEFTSLPTQLWSPFFIGDGDTTRGAGQTFRVPTGGADTLYLGIPDSYSFQGPPQKYEDNNGSFTARIRWRIPSQNAMISGRVLDSFGEPADNVLLNAKRGSKQVQSVTGEDGFFEFTFAAPDNKGKATVTPKPRPDQKITPKSVTVTLRPGKTAFAKFKAEVGEIKGLVRELICPAPVDRANCSEKVALEGAKVELRGGGLRETKFTDTKADGTYSFKVPPGRYDVRVNEALVAPRRHSDVCRDDPRLPILAADVARDPKPARCVKNLIRTRGDRQRGREPVVVDLKAGKRESVPFLAVPRHLVLTAELSKFAGGGRSRRSRTTVITSGLTDPVAPWLVGPLGPTGIAYRPAREALLCRSGCAVVDVQVTNLLGEPEPGITVGFRALPLSSPDNAVELEGGGGQATGFACRFGRSPATCAPGAPFTRGTTDESGRLVGLYAAPGVVPGHALPDARPDGPITAGVEVVLPEQGIFITRSERTLPLTIEPNQVAGSRGKTVGFNQQELDLLNVMTDPATAKEGVKNIFKAPGNACEKVLGLIPSLLNDAFGKVKLIDTGDDDALKVSNIQALCDRVDLPKYITNSMEDFLENSALSMLVLSKYGLSQDGLSSGFGIDVTEGPSVKAIKLRTAADKTIADFLRAWRLEHGFASAIDNTPRPLTTADRVSLELFEVSRLAFVNTSMRPQPALYLHLRAPGFTTRFTGTISSRYDPVRWLSGS